MALTEAALASLYMKRRKLTEIDKSSLDYKIYQSAYENDVVEVEKLIQASPRIEVNFAANTSKYRELAALGFVLGGHAKQAKAYGLQNTQSNYFYLNKILQDQLDSATADFIYFKQQLRYYNCTINSDFANAFLLYQNFDPTEQDDLTKFKAKSEQWLKPATEFYSFEKLSASHYKIPELFKLHKLVSQALAIATLPSYLPNADLETAVTCLNKLDDFFCNFKKDNPAVNAHQNPNLDKLLGIRNTRPWRHTAKAMRANAFKQLINYVYQQNNRDDKLTLLNLAKGLPIFNEHRNNSIFFGAFGKTATVRKIETEIKKLDLVEKSKVIQLKL